MMMVEPTKLQPHAVGKPSPKPRSHGQLQGSTRHLPGRTKKVQLQGATAAGVSRQRPTQCACARTVCAVCVYSVFRPSSPRDKGSAPRGEMEWAKLCCSTPLRRLERTPPPFPVATWWLWGLLAVPSVVFFCKETRCEICESTETVRNFRGEPALVT